MTCDACAAGHCEYCDHHQNWGRYNPAIRSINDGVAVDCDCPCAARLNILMTVAERSRLRLIIDAEGLGVCGVGPDAQRHTPA